MASSAPIFYNVVVFFISTIVLIFSVIVQVVALIHCLTQRGDGFQAIGTLPKGAWAAILIACIFFTLVARDPTSIFSFLGIIAALIYLLDVRPGLRDLSDGKGIW
jgi:hypothetical protein